MKLLNLETVSFSALAEGDEGLGLNVIRLFICVSGYEERSIHWASRIVERYPANKNNYWSVLGFKDGKEELSRQKSDEFYSKHQIPVRDYASSDGWTVCIMVLKELATVIRLAGNNRVEIHIDYSSMPRVWYCSLFEQVEKSIRSTDALFFWYAAGLYEQGEYPTAGVSDISVFSGKPSLFPRNRTHVFGLGFDQIRASAIFRVLDPQNLICFYADPGIRHDYVKKVYVDNRDLLSSSKLVFTAPIGDFCAAFGRINAIAREALASGDVILVPDGPKPLVLASSIVPSFLKCAGVVSLHVRRRKALMSGSIDVKAAGPIYGFSVSGSFSLVT